MYRIYVNYNNEIIEEYDSLIAWYISMHLFKYGMLVKVEYTDEFNNVFIVE